MIFVFFSYFLVKLCQQMRWDNVLATKHLISGALKEGFMIDQNNSVANNANANLKVHQLNEFMAWQGSFQ